MNHLTYKAYNTNKPNTSQSDKNMYHLLGKVFPGILVEIAAESSDEADGKLLPVLDLSEVREAIQHNTHQTGLHHKLILQGNKYIIKLISWNITLIKHKDERQQRRWYFLCT